MLAVDEPIPPCKKGGYINTLCLRKLCRKQQCSSI